MTRSSLEDTWVDITALRTELVDLLAGLPDQAWDTQSLCPGWLVRDVAAHVLLPPRLTLFALPGLARTRFDVARYVHDDAVRRAAAPVPELITAFRHAVDRTWLPPTRRPEHLLADLFIHTQDIRWPLGLRTPSPPDLLRSVLRTVAADTVIGDPARVAGVSLIATDVDWFEGAGPEVAGPAEALILVMSGRRAALDELHGAGVAVLEPRLP